MEEQIKICNNCGEEKSFDDFPNDKYRRDGKKSKCKECHNAHVRSLRGGKKSPVSLVSEGDEFEKKLIEFVKTYKNFSKFDTEFVSKIPENMEKFYEEARYPPTNEIEICGSSISGGGSFDVNVSIILSKLSLFLVQKRSLLMNISEIKTLKHAKYAKNNVIVIILPKNILLSHKEIEEFTDSLVIAQIDKKNFVNINVEDVDLMPFLADFPSIIRNFLLKECGYEIDKSSISLKIVDNENVIAKWPKRGAIDSREVETLQKNMLSHIIAGI